MASFVCVRSTHHSYFVRTFRLFLCFGACRRSSEFMILMDAVWISFYLGLWHLGSLDENWFGIFRSNSCCSDFKSPSFSFYKSSCSRFEKQDDPLQYQGIKPEIPCCVDYLCWLEHMNFHCDYRFFRMELPLKKHLRIHQQLTGFLPEY